jgi:hypothetical protein
MLDLGFLGLAIIYNVRPRCEFSIMFGVRPKKFKTFSIFLILFFVNVKKYFANFSNEKIFDKKHLILSILQQIFCEWMSSLLLEGISSFFCIILIQILQNICNISHIQQAFCISLPSESSITFVVKFF